MHFKLGPIVYHNYAIWVVIGQPTFVPTIRGTTRDLVLTHLKYLVQSTKSIKIM